VKNILTKGHIAGVGDFSWGKCNATPKSTPKNGISIGSDVLHGSPFCLNLQNPMLYNITFQWAGQPPKLPLPIGGSGPLSNTWFLLHTRVSSPNSILIGSAFSASSLTWPTNRETQTDHYTPSVL